MGEIASASQLRMSYVRWALVTVPSILLFGIISALIAGSGDGNPWFDAMRKPWFMPPAWVFPVMWSTLYLLMGIAFAQVLGARGARGRTTAITLFLVQLLINYTWSPVFFAWHQVLLALGMILVLVVLVFITILRFSAIRPQAGLLLVPYLLWLLVATALNFEFNRLNPDAASVVVQPGSTQITI